MGGQGGLKGDTPMGKGSSHPQVCLLRDTLPLACVCTGQTSVGLFLSLYLCACFFSPDSFCLSSPWNGELRSCYLSRF